MKKNLNIYKYSSLYLIIIEITLGVLIFLSLKKIIVWDNWLFTLPLILIFIGTIIAHIINYFAYNIHEANLEFKSDYEVDLKDDYFKQYAIIRDIVLSSNLPEKMIKEVNNDILDLFLTAQNSGKSTNNVVKDPKDFALEVIESYEIRNWFLFFLLEGIFNTTIFVLSYFLLYGFLTGIGPDLFHFDLPLYSIPGYLLLTMYLLPFSKLSKTTKKIPKGVWIMFLLFLIFILSYFICFFSPGLKEFFSQEVKLIPNIYVLLIYILIIPLAILLKKTLRNKTKIQLISGD